jgi:hypothetical protein
MSATIRYRPVVKQDHRYIRTGAPSAALAALSIAFGERTPWRLSSEEVNTLRGMAAAFGHGRPDENPYTQMLSLIEHYGEIEVWPEY